MAQRHVMDRRIPANGLFRAASVRTRITQLYIVRLYEWICFNLNWHEPKCYLHIKFSMKIWHPPIVLRPTKPAAATPVQMYIFKIAKTDWWWPEFRIPLSLTVDTHTKALAMMRWTNNRRFSELPHCTAIFNLNKISIRPELFMLFYCASAQELAFIHTLNTEQFRPVRIADPEHSS